MPKFSIFNRVMDEDLGTYEAETEDAALDVMARSYGFADYAESIADYGLTVEDGKAELDITPVDA